MNNSESYERARKDVLDMLEKWAEEDMRVEECLFAALPIILQALFEMAPSTRAAHGMLAICFNESYNREKDENNDVR